MFAELSTVVRPAVLSKLGSLCRIRWVRGMSCSATPQLSGRIDRIEESVPLQS